MVTKLPEFKGYTVDIKLRQFRKVSKNKEIEFIEFDSVEGDGLLGDYIETLDMNKPEEKEILERIWK